MLKVHTHQGILSKIPDHRLIIQGQTINQVPEMLLPSEGHHPIIPNPVPARIVMGNQVITEHQLTEVQVVVITIIVELKDHIAVPEEVVIIILIVLLVHQTGQVQHTDLPDHHPVLPGVQRISLPAHREALLTGLQAVQAGVAHLIGHHQVVPAPFKFQIGDIIRVRYIIKPHFHKFTGL